MTGATTKSEGIIDKNAGLAILDATAKSLKNAAKTMSTLQNQVGKILLTLASYFI